QSVPAQPLHQRRAAAWGASGSGSGSSSGTARDSLTIGEDLYAIISEFSVVADGRYGEVDARTLRKRDMRVSRAVLPPATYPPGSAATSPDIYGGGRRMLAPAADGDYGEVRRGLPAESVSSTASNVGLPVARTASHTSTSAASAGAGPGDYGRHTAARARAWASRQKERVFHALSGEKSSRQPQSPGGPAGLRGADLTAALPLPAPVSPGMRLHHQSHSTTNVVTPPVPRRLSGVPSTGHLR
ncbi:hypothetical protein IWQ57_005490, partial [Coemansia nantahalensis]